MDGSRNDMRPAYAPGFRLLWPWMALFVVLIFALLAALWFQTVDLGTTGVTGGL